ncbi:MAG: type 1 glutamine amidotransferase domain-containing protein [Bacteroidales bacterium]|nr:type 1 glutamine amidotransferase domain-containing protein [Bacteroidales bacterium]
MNTKKILVVLTNRSQIPGKKHKTGIWFSELVHFLHIAKQNNLEVTMASTMGGHIPIDEFSTRRFFMDRLCDRYYYSKDFLPTLETTIALDDVDPKAFAAIYFVGGPGCLYDYLENMRIADVTQKIFENGGVVSSIGYGVCAMLNLKTSNDEYFIDRKEITAFSRRESAILGLYKKLPIILRNELEKRNAFYSKTHIPFTSYAIRDGRVITGENPQSVQAVAWQTVKAIG